MIHFVYPNANIMKSEFIGCGRYIASEKQPDKYKLPSKIYNKTKVIAAAEILAHESFETNKTIYEKKDRPDSVYMGESKNLAYLLAMISRSRELRFKLSTDIWCTGSIEVINDEPFLNAVMSDGFDIKLRQGFLSEENQDTLFIVPEGNFLPTHQELCDQKNVRVFSVEQFREQYAEYDFRRKTVLRVRSDELFDLTSLVFEMSQNPYKGLEAFEEEDAGRFFGRDEVIQELYDIYQNTCKSHIRLMAILGPSGSGKSSIAKAGFIPKIRSSDSSIILFRPGEHPLETLNKKLSEIPDSASHVIIADQFEETYSLCKDKQERTEFINTLMAQASASASVIIVLRTDFLGQTQGYPEFNYAITHNKIIVSAMQPYNLRAVIAEPAKRAGYLFDVKIVDELISQTKGHDGALPLLEFALSAIWQGMEKGVSPEKTLKAINGVGGALAKKAKELYDSLSSEQDKRIIRRTFLRLINIGEGMFDTRRRVPLSELVAKDEDIAYVRKVLGIFSAPGARLITLSADSEGNEIVEITHEALFEHWEDLKIWIDENRDDIRFHRRLSEAVTHWDNNNKPEGSLWRSPDLDNLHKFYKNNRQDMTLLQINFYEESKKLKELEENEKESIRQRELEQAQALTEEQRKRADEQAEAARKLRESLAKYYHINALNAEKEGDSLRALHYFARSEKESFEVGSLFVRDQHFDSHAVMDTSCLVWQIEGVEGMVFSKDESRILTWSGDTVNLWNAETGKPIGQPMKHAKRKINRAMFSNDDSLILTWSDDGIARLWNAKNCEVIGEPIEQDIRRISGKSIELYHVNGAIFSNDDSRILTWSDDGKARLWNAETGTEVIRQPTNNEKGVERAVFSKDEAQISIYSLYSLDMQYEKSVNCDEVLFSKDRSRILTWSNDTAYLWNTENCATIGQPMKHEKAVKGAVFSKDGSRILIWDGSGARLWNGENGEAIGQPMKHENYVCGAVFSNDESRIWTWSFDGMVRLWNGENGEAIDHNEKI